MVQTRSGQEPLAKPLKDARQTAASVVSEVSEHVLTGPATGEVAAALPKKIDRAVRHLVSALDGAERTTDLDDHAAVAEAYASLQTLAALLDVAPAAKLAELRQSRPQWFASPPRLNFKASEQRRKRGRENEDDDVALRRKIDEAVARRLGDPQEQVVTEALLLLGKSKSDPPRPFNLRNLAVSLSPVMMMAFVRHEGVTQVDIVGRFGEQGVFGTALKSALERSLEPEGLPPMAATEKAQIGPYVKKVLMLAKQLVRESEEITLLEFAQLYEEMLAEATAVAAHIGAGYAERARGPAAAGAFSGVRAFRADALPLEWGNAIEAANRTAERAPQPLQPNRENGGLSATQMRNRRRRQSWKEIRQAERDKRKAQKPDVVDLTGGHPKKKDG